MEKFVTSNLKLGIITGGQLGKMLIQEASKWDMTTYVLDPDDHCPASGIASVCVQGSRHDFEAVYQFGKQVDLLTFEIESVNIEALYQLKAEGLTIVPDPAILALIQDKGLQKDFYRQHHIPTAAYQRYETKEEIIEAIAAQQLNTPFVQKLRRGGYDGRGVSVIHSPHDMGSFLDGASVVEEKVDIDKEIAVIAARNKRGDIACFPPVEMVFDSQANLVERLVCPSGISPELSHKAEMIAATLIEKLDMAGLLAVEFFVDKQGHILVNEAAPRPHNSGHHTLESVLTSQFEQHLRAILNLPLGSTRLKMAAVMLNLLGEAGHNGPVKYEGLTESLAIEGVNIHIYGKQVTRPARKMGHVTIVSPTMADALAKADKVKPLIKVTAWDKNE